MSMDPALAALGEVDAVDPHGGRDVLEGRQRIDERGVGVASGVADDRTEELGAPVWRGVPEAEEAVQLLLQVAVHGVQQQHAQGLHRRNRWEDHGRQRWGDK